MCYGKYNLIWFEICFWTMHGCLTKIQHETELFEDIMLPGFPTISSKFGSSEDEFMDSDDLANSRPRTRPAAVQNPRLTDSNVAMAPAGSVKHEFRRRHLLHGWLHKLVRLVKFGLLSFCNSNMQFPKEIIALFCIVIS